MKCLAQDLARLAEYWLVLILAILATILQGQRSYPDGGVLARPGKDSVHTGGVLRVDAWVARGGYLTQSFTLLLPVLIGTL